jgi:hypothetical protein
LISSSALKQKRNTIHVDLISLFFLPKSFESEVSLIIIFIQTCSLLMEYRSSKHTHFFFCLICTNKTCVLLCANLF